LIACATVKAGEPFPAENTDYFDDSGFDSSFEGKLIALEGQITRIELAPQGRPLIQLLLPAPLYRSVWVGVLIPDASGQLKQGHVVRVLGYLQQVAPDDTWTKAITADPHHVLGFCFLNLTSMQGIYLPAGIRQCQAWEAGQSAEALSK
jgi:hypothetical protein